MSPCVTSRVKFCIHCELSRFFIILLLTSVMSETVKLENQLDRLTAGELDRVAHRAMSCHNIPSLGLSIVVPSSSNGAVKFWKTYRAPFFDAERMAENSTRSDPMFCIGSLTKHISATLILHQLEQLQWKGYTYTVGTLVTDIIPALGLEYSQLANATIEDILSHRTGLAEFFGPFLVGYPTGSSRLDLAKIAARLPRIHPSGTSYVYNNHVFSLSGLIAETLGELLYGKPKRWEELASDLLQEAGVSTGDFSFADTVEDARVEKGFLSVDGKLRAMDPEVRQLIAPAGAAGSLCITPQAMARWMSFLLRRGEDSSVSRETIVNPWTTRNINPSTILSSVEFPDGPVVNARCGYGLGWGCYSYRGHKYVAHGGGFYAFISKLLVFPDQNISIFTSTSGPGTSDVAITMRKLHLYIFDRLMGYSPQPLDFVCPPPLLTPAPTSKTLDNFVPLRILEGFLGEYQHGVFGTIKVIVKNKEVRLLAGRFGEAILVNCVSHPDNTAVCQLEFTGILWWISGSDAFKNDKQTNRTAIFRLVHNAEQEARTLTLPLYSSAAPPLFTRKPRANGITSLQITERATETIKPNSADKNRSGNVSLMTILIISPSCQLKILPVFLILSMAVLMIGLA
ncbi:hypothetical protein RvY_01835 [Ramazzottius varieornatus]|uniref:Beta-lactamase-related domain-containing protein n=1 Tax=Ramazzottius varieornatus TaxID=947166 RepID=A0A1D1UHV4_RAMVA|nr:hypothetical protein RvY_01835 [Ramazzottius varieornatus]